jgi:hypothetical protein
MRHQPKIVAAAVLTVAVAGAATVSAQTTPGSLARPATRQLAPGLSDKPFARLFAQKKPLPTVRPRLEVRPDRPDFTRPNSARNFICSTPVLPADPTLDPGMEKAPADTTTQFTLRIVPPTCG